MHRKMIIGAALVLLLMFAAGIEATWRPEIEEARIRILILMGTGIGSVLTAVWVYHRRIAAPLQAVKEAAEQMAAGRLNRSASVSAVGDIGKLGDAINDLAANQQEMLLVVWNHCQKAASALDDLGGTGQGPDAQEPIERAELENGLGQIRWHLQEIDALVASFDYYEVALDDRRMRTITAPAVSTLSN